MSAACARAADADADAAAAEVEKGVGVVGGEGEGPVLRLTDGRPAVVEAAAGDDEACKSVGVGARAAA